MLWRYVFGPCELDTAKRTLWRRGQSVEIQAKSFDLLVYLIEHRDRVVSTSEILDALWGDVAVTPSALSRAVHKARQAVGDDGEAQRIIATVHGRGFRFVAEVGVSDGQPSEISKPPLGSFVGRTREMGMLRAKLAEAAEGRGSIVLLVGEPGIGKTRLTDELARHARTAGAEVLVGRCYEGEGAPAFWPWVQILRGYLRERDAAILDAELGDAAPYVATICPEVRARLPHLPAPPNVDDSARFRVFEGVTGTLTRAAAARPIVLILDDLHGADEPSLRMLQFLARAVHHTRILVVGALRARALSSDHPLAETLGELVREQAEQLSLAGLSEDEVGELLARVVGWDAPAELTRAVHARTEGNPLYVVETARMFGAAGGFESALGGRLEMPDTVRLAIERNLSGLSNGCRELLTLASLCGREFRLGMLLRASGLDRELLLALLSEAESSGVVRAITGEPDGMRFTHALFGETLADALGAVPRAIEQRRLAEALASAPNAEEHAAEVAYHWSQAGPTGNPQQAVEWACRAAERALGLLAYEEAVRLYGMALRALAWSPAAQDKRRAEVILGLGDALKKAGELAQAKEAFLECAALARKLGSPDLLTRAALGYAPPVSYAVQPEPDAAVVRLLEEAIAAWDGRDSGLHACALARLALTLLFGDEARKLELLQLAVPMARRSDSASTLRYVLVGWLGLHPTRDTDPAERLAIASELVQLAQAASDLEALAVGRLWRAVHLLETGDADGMRRERAALAYVSTQLRQPLWSWYARVMEIAEALLDGRLDDGERAIAEAFAIAENVVPYAANAYFVCPMMFVRTLQGRPDEYASVFRTLFEAHPSLVAISPLAWIEGERGDTDEVRRIVERCTADDFESVRTDVASSVAICFLAEGCASIGDATRAARLHELMAGIASQWVVWAEGIPVGPRAHYLGLLARTIGRLDEAAGHFEAALATCARANAPIYLARAQYEYARTLHARGANGDPERARDLLRKARATAETIGLGGLRARIAALGAAGTRDPGSADSSRSR